jgi:hypothetical protein
MSLESLVRTPLRQAAGALEAIWCVPNSKRFLFFCALHKKTAKDKLSPNLFAIFV